VEPERNTHGFRSSRVAMVLLALLVLEVAAFTVATIPGVRASGGFDALIDGWLQGAGYVTAAALAVLRPLTSAVDRWVWSWLAAAVVARAVGFVLFLAVVRWQDPPPYPSLADAGWLSMYLFMLLGLIALARLRTLRLSTPLLLDGAVGALAAAAVAVAVLYPAVLVLSAPGIPAGTVAVNLAYPVLDVGLFVRVVGLLMLLEWQAPPAVWSRRPVASVPGRSSRPWLSCRWRWSPPPGGSGGGPGPRDATRCRTWCSPRCSRWPASAC
jgi:hypothetical protein